MKCIKCGYEFSDGRFCPKCGTEIKEHDMNEKHSETKQLEEQVVGENNPIEASKGFGSEQEQQTSEETDKGKIPVYYRMWFIILVGVMTPFLLCVPGIILYVKRNKRYPQYKKTARIAVCSYIAVCTLLGLISSYLSGADDRAITKLIEKGEYENAINYAKAHFDPAEYVYFQKQADIYEAQGDIDGAANTILEYAKGQKNLGDLDSDATDRLETYSKKASNPIKKEIKSLLSSIAKSKRKQTKKEKPPKDEDKSDVEDKNSNDDKKTEASSDDVNEEKDKDGSSNDEKSSSMEKIDIPPKEVERWIKSKALEEDFNGDYKEEEIESFINANYSDDSLYLAWKKSLLDYYNESGVASIKSNSNTFVSLKNFCDVYETLNSKGYKKHTEEINVIKENIEKMESLSIDILAKQELLDQQNEDYFSADVLQGSFYVINRLQYQNTILGNIANELNSAKSAPEVKWVASDIKYIDGDAFPSDEREFVLRTNDVYTFSTQGVYDINYFDTGETEELIDSAGFHKIVPIYEVIDYNTLEKTQSEIDDLHAAYYYSDAIIKTTLEDNSSEQPEIQ